MLKCILKEMKAKAVRDLPELVKFMGYVALVITILAVLGLTFYVAVNAPVYLFGSYDPSIGLLVMLVLVFSELAFTGLAWYLYASYKAAKKACLNRAQGNP